MKYSEKMSAKEKIEKSFIELIQTRDINDISVTSLVNYAKVNRSTFYLNYLDIYDLAEKIKEKMYKDLLELYQDEAICRKHSYNFLKLFTHIKDNQIYYKTMFKLKFNFFDYCDFPMDVNDALKYLGTKKDLDYHVEFFKAGVSAIILKWLFNGCKESPHEMAEIIRIEYKGKSQ